MAGTLASKIAFITGSESGIGQAIAQEFAKAGADVVVTFHADRAGAEETGRRVKAAGRRVHLQQLDVRDETSVAAAFREAVAQLGAPEILVNGAGVIGKGMAVADMPAEVAKLALHLASDDADYITGQSFTIDGGLELDWGQDA